MKIACCLFKYFPFGGLSRDFNAIVTALVQHGYEVDIYTLRWEGPKIQYTSVIELPFRQLFNYQRYRAFSAYVAQHLPKKNYHLVIGFNKLAGLDIYYAADPCFWAKSYHSCLFRYHPRYKALLQLEQMTLHPSAETKILLLSQQQLTEFHRCYGTPLKRFVMLPPWIETEKFQVAKQINAGMLLRERYQLKKETRLLLFVGSGFWTKGLDRALRAMAALPARLLNQTQLFIIGQDKSRYFQRLTQKLKLSQQVHFLGGRLDVPDWLDAADVLIHPARKENTGNVLLEAHYSQLPVLTTAVCGFSVCLCNERAHTVLSTHFVQNDLNEALQRMLLRDKPKFHTTQQVFDKQNMLKMVLDEVKSAKNKRKNPLSLDYYIYPELMDKLPSFERVMQLDGEIFRAVKNRKTLLFRHNGQAYFLKTHCSITYKELLKNLLQCRRPVLSAKNEWHAIQYLEEKGILLPSIVGYGEKSLFFPWQKVSFLMTRALLNTISLETLTFQFEKPVIKWRLIREMAKMVRCMHQNNMVHRDLYLCHFLLDEKTLRTQQPLLYLIDLHRALIFSKTLKNKWIIKELAGLFYSAVGKNLSKTDYWRFWTIYSFESGENTLSLKQRYRRLWPKIARRYEKLAQRVRH